MAECQNGPESNLPCTMIEEQAESCNPPAPGDDIKSEVLDLEGIPDREKKSVHKKHQNGIVTTLMRASEDADNGESADSGHGSSCHDCECSADMPVNMESNMENDMSQLSLTDNRLADPGSGCGDAPGASQQLGSEDDHGIKYDVYESEEQMPDIIRLITKDLSEPYSIYTYRYFIHNWPNLCLLAKDGDVYVGAIVCKLERHKKMAVRGYIAMLAIDAKYRRRKIGSTLVTKAIQAMITSPIGCDEVVLETEITNMGALRLYENLGFIRDKRLFRYYLNGVDALRLKLWLR